MKRKIYYFAVLTPFILATSSFDMWADDPSTSQQSRSKISAASQRPKTFRELKAAEQERLSNFKHIKTKSPYLPFAVVMWGIDGLAKPKSPVVNDQITLSRLWTAWRQKGPVPVINFETHVVLVKPYFGHVQSYYRVKEGNLQVRFVSETKGPGKYFVFVVSRGRFQSFEGERIQSTVVKRP